MLKIVRRGKKGIYQIVGTCPITGGSIRKSTGTDSERHADAFRVQLETRLLDERTFGKRATATFAEAVVLYQQKGHGLRYSGLLTRHFGARRLDSITDLDVANFAALHYPNAKPQTINRQVYTPLISIWRVAHAARMCGPHEFRRPKQPEREAVVFATDEDIARLLKVSDQRGIAAILLLTFTGARASEVCRVTVADIDWEARTILFRKTKPGKPRMVPLAPMVLEALLPLRQVQGPLLGFRHLMQLDRVLKAACKAAGLPALSSHKIGRHAFAARLLRQGKTLKEVQEAGGWGAASMAMIAATYAHLERKAVDAAVREADGPLAQLLQNKKRGVA
jgi:integrase